MFAMFKRRKYNMRLFAISDIHGCLQQFEALIEKINLTKEDKLIILGDCIDRGPNSLGVVMKIHELKTSGYNIVTLKGNHEDMFLNVIEDSPSLENLSANHDIHTLIYNGVYKTLEDYYLANKSTQSTVLNELQNYKLYHIEKLNGQKYLFVHAGIWPNVPLKEQCVDDLLWIRGQFMKEKHGMPYTVVFGHTPTPTFTKNPEIWFDSEHQDKIAIDCGCFFSGKLACLELPNTYHYSD